MHISLNWLFVRLTFYISFHSAHSTWLSANDLNAIEKFMMKAMSELLKHKPRQRDSILDHGEIKQAAQARGPALHQERGKTGWNLN